MKHLNSLLTRSLPRTVSRNHKIGCSYSAV
ncbi:hypothetical protein E2C01_052247 [Portunus trituberculatus]|uniref:Uncharacterized protein n=1 Tax=Portunus trituberculatus TaxID=210409 RepID=A0A5B7GDX4_PORTR|nr:hypothetical protein [Portunus trituberculatus]